MPQIGTMRNHAHHAASGLAAKIATRELDTVTTEDLLGLIEELSASQSSVNTELDTQWVM